MRKSHQYRINNITLLLYLLKVIYLVDGFANCTIISFDSCKNCHSILNGEYMGKDGVPYCEKCYQKLFGVKCAYCNRYISGKVLQAGDNHHFHPTCARCTKCGDPFGDGEEMYLQGSAGELNR